MNELIPHLFCEILGPQALALQAADGVERLNTSYQWTLLLAKPAAAFDPSLVLGAQAKLLLPSAFGMRPIHGIISAWTEQKNGDYVEVRLEPRVSLMSIGQRSRSFTKHGDETERVEGDSIALDIIEQCMREYKLSSDDITIGIQNRDEYPARNYLAQFNESDWDFCMRWLEHEGVHFHFLQDEQREIIYFGDHNEAFPLYTQTLDISDDPDQTHGSITDCRMEWSQTVQHVGVTDYNWRSQNCMLHQELENEDDRAFGSDIEYNEHVKTTDEAKWLLQRRAELDACEHNQLFAESTVNDLHAGHIITIREADTFALPEGQFLVTEIQHHWKAQQIAADASLQAEYSNSFIAIPASLSFRPTRETEWPHIPAFTVGEIMDPDDDKKRGAAPLDTDGRYLVHQKWDGNPDDIPSRRMRMIQHSTGSSSGMHFPLRSQSEVLSVGIDGDPDRGIILGSIPNRKNTSVVNSENQHLNKFKSQQGHEWNWDERPDQEAVTFKDAGGSIWSRQGQRKEGTQSDNTDSQSDFSGPLSFSSSSTFSGGSNSVSYALDLLNQLPSSRSGKPTASEAEADLENVYWNKPDLIQGTHFDDYKKEDPASVSFSLNAKDWPDRKTDTLSRGYTARSSSHPITDSTFESQELWDKGKISVTAGDSLKVHYGEIYIDCKGNSVNYFKGDVYEFGQSGDDQIIGDAHHVVYADIYEEWNFADKIYHFDRQGGSSLCDNRELTYVLNLEWDIKLYNNEFSEGEMGFKMIFIPATVEISAVALKGTAELTTKMDIEFKRVEKDLGDNFDTYKLEIFPLKTLTNHVRTETWENGTDFKYGIKSTVSLLQMVTGLKEVVSVDKRMMGGSTHDITNHYEVSLFRLDQAAFQKASGSPTTP